MQKAPAHVQGAQQALQEAVRAHLRCRDGSLRPCTLYILRAMVAARCFRLYAQAELYMQYVKFEKLLEFDILATAELLTAQEHGPHLIIIAWWSSCPAGSASVGPMLPSLQCKKFKSVHNGFRQFTECGVHMLCSHAFA